MTVRRRLAVSVAALLLLSAVGAALSVVATHRTMRALGDLHAADASQRALAALDRELQARWREVHVLRALSPTPAQVAIISERLDALDERVAASRHLVTGDDLTRVYADVSASWRATIAALDRALEQRPAPADLNVLLTGLDAQREAADRQALASLQQSLGEARTTTRTVFVVLVLATLSGAIVVAWLSLSISRGLGALAHAASRVADGDYAFRIGGQGHDEFAVAARAFDSMSEALAGATAAIRAAQQQAESASAAKSDFLTSMSHDLRTPLTAILGYADLIEAEAVQTGLSSVESDVAQLRRSAKVLLGMVQELLDFARLEAGRMTVELGVVDLSDLLDEAAATVRPLAHQRGNRLVIGGTRCEAIVSDPTKVRHIVQNLIGNACKFTDAGLIEVSTVACPGAESGVELRVRDTGIGMSQADVARVFSPYEQASPAVSSRYGGSGLGLAIAKRFIDLLGGRISVTSALGEGSTFVVWLPDLSTAAHPTIDAEAAEAGAIVGRMDHPGHADGAGRWAVSASRAYLPAPARPS